MNSGMKFKAVAAIVLSVAIAGCGGGGGNDDDNANTGSNATPQSGTVSGAGAEYLTQTYQTGQSQAQQSQTAAQKSTNPAVKELAQQVNLEVTVINQQITNISQNSNVKIVNTLTNEQQTQINNLNALSGEELDRAYLRNLVDAMKSLLASTLREAREGSDVRIRQVAATNVLVIEQRLATAEETLFILEPAQYLAGAFEDSLLEAELGRVAVSKATDAQVKQFAQKMIDEHTQLNSRTTILAAQKSVSLPTVLSQDKQEIVASISAFTGADFDKAYMDRNVLLHAEDIAKTTAVAQQSDDADVKALAAETLPLLQAHFQEAATIAAALQPTPVYQLGQSLISELQLAQLAQTRSADEQGKQFGQTIVQQNQAAFEQLVQLARQENVQLPLVIPPGRVQAALQLLQAGTVDLQAIQELIASQLMQSLQIAQSLQTSNAAGVGTVARTRIDVLQNLNASGQSGVADGSIRGTDGNSASTDPGTSGTGTDGSGGTSNTVSDGAAGDSTAGAAS